MANDQTTDEQIAAQVQKIPEMFGFLIDRYENKLDRYIQRKTNLPSDLRQDILQEVFVKAYQNIASFDVRMSFNSWIYRICYNTLVTDWKNNQRYRQGLSFDDEQNLFLDNLLREDSVEIEADRLLLQKLINKQILQLDSKYQDVITLRFLEELSYDEISDVLQIPPGTVATQISRAKKQLMLTLQSLQDN